VTRKRAGQFPPTAAINQEAPTLHVWAQHFFLDLKARIWRLAFSGKTVAAPDFSVLCSETNSYITWSKTCEARSLGFLEVDVVA
jgi:hypothetical protein